MLYDPGILHLTEEVVQPVVPVLDAISATVDDFLLAWALENASHLSTATLVAISDIAVRVRAHFIVVVNCRDLIRFDAIDEFKELAGTQRAHSKVLRVLFDFKYKIFGSRRRVQCCLVDIVFVQRHQLRKSMIGKSVHFDGHESWILTETWCRTTLDGICKWILSANGWVLQLKVILFIVAK